MLQAAAAAAATNNLKHVLRAAITQMATPPDAGTVKLQKLIDAAIASGRRCCSRGAAPPILNLSEHFPGGSVEINQTLYIDGPLTLTANPNVSPPYEPREQAQTVKNFGLTLTGDNHVPTVFIGSRAKLATLGTRDGSDVNTMYPSPTPNEWLSPDSPVNFDVSQVTISNLSIMGNNYIFQNVGGHTNPLKDQPHSVQQEYQRYTKAGLVFRDGKCAGQQIGLAVPPTCNVTGDELKMLQHITEADQNFSQYAVCKFQTQAVCAAFVEKSYNNSVYKSSVVTAVKSSFALVNCALRNGCSAGVGANAFCNVRLTSCYMTQNRWDGFGPDSLGWATLRDCFSVGNYMGVGVSASKGVWTRNNGPIYIIDCVLDDGMVCSHYTDWYVKGGSLGFPVYTGQGDHPPSSHPTAVYFDSTCKAPVDLITTGRSYVKPDPPYLLPVVVVKPTTPPPPPCSFVDAGSNLHPPPRIAFVESAASRRIDASISPPHLCSGSGVVVVRGRTRWRRRRRPKSVSVAGRRSRRDVEERRFDGFCRICCCSPKRPDDAERRPVMMMTRAECVITTGVELKGPRSIGRSIIVPPPCIMNAAARRQIRQKGDGTINGRSRGPCIRRAISQTDFASFVKSQWDRQIRGGSPRRRLPAPRTRSQSSQARRCRGKSGCAVLAIEGRG